MVVDLSPEEELRLRIEASQQGVDAAEFARQAILDRIADLRARQRPFKLEMPEGGAAARRLLAQWREEDYTEDPDLIREAEADLAEFMRQMNASRARDEPLFPEVADVEARH